MGTQVPTMTDSDVLARNDELRDALRRAASALKAHGPEFALAGSYALWVHGGPEPVHDVDFVVAEEDAEAAAKTLEEAGFRIDRTPEDWLFKACAGKTSSSTCCIGSTVCRSTRETIDSARDASRSSRSRCRCWRRRTW